jgi:hypothetical protein
MEWLARENNLAVNRLLSQPDPAAAVRLAMMDKTMGKEQVAMLLRHGAAELNRYTFEIWETVQIVLAGLFFFFLLFGTREGKIPLALALALLVAVLAQRFLLSPEITAFGKLVDFVAPSGLHGERAKLQVMQYAYLGVDIGKWIVQGTFAVLLIGRGRLRSTESASNFPAQARLSR